MDCGGDEQSKELRRSSSSSCGGANAEARMKFASVDALSELVWSPRNGLSLRCADLSFTAKGNLLSPNVFDAVGGQTNNMEALSKSSSVQEQEEQEEEEEEAGFRVNVESKTRGFVEMDRADDDEVNQACRPVAEIGGSVEELKPEREEMVEDKVETNDDGESEEAETRVGSSKRSLDSPRAIGGETRDLLANGSQEEPANVDRLEATDENELATLDAAASKALVACESRGECLPEDETDVEKAGPSGSYRRKGKGKALSDGNFDGNDGNDDDDESFGSVESCNSAGLLLRGKKRAGFEQQLILGSKRLKTLSQECLGSTSKLKQDSSFMNWISNMTKGIWKGNEEEHSPSPFVALTTTSDANVQVDAMFDQKQMDPCCPEEDNGCRNTGFQSFFQSIYCQKKRSHEAIEMDSANEASLQELPSIPEQCTEIAPVAEPEVGFNQTSQTFSSDNKDEDKEPNNISLLPLNESKPSEEQKACGEADEKVTQCSTNRNSGLESLWISRFSSKSSLPQRKDLPERMDSASDAAKTRDSQKMLTDNQVTIPSVSTVEGSNNPNTVLPLVSSLRIESSEAMASLFARRLEAMKHIMPSGSSEEEQKNLICFYCGKKGHRLRDCLEVTDTELRDLVQNISARNGSEEAFSSLCIRCLQLSHWAATCPNAPPYSSGAEDRAMKHALASTSGTKLPLIGLTEVPKAVFDAVQVLRLTRTDILKWINTKKSVSGLEGFFLRLRLGKWEEGLGGTGYYVARIDGAIEGQSSRKHSENSSVSVKVGGMTCFVESQFISNHDFLEEELKAWWRSAGKNDGRSGGDSIPSAEELCRKIQQRKMLGF